MSQDDDLSAMSLDELWRAHQMIAQLLFERLMARHRQLDEKLAVVRRGLPARAGGADDAMPTTGRAAVSKPARKPGNGATKDPAFQKADS